MLREGFDVIMYVDDDAFVYQHDKPIGYWLNKFPKKDLIIAEEQNYKRTYKDIPYVNTGVLICRNTKWVYQLFYDLLNNSICKRNKKGTAKLQDQPCLQKLLHTKYKDHKKHIGFISACDFNCNNTPPKWYYFINATICKDKDCNPFIHHHVKPGAHLNHFQNLLKNI